MTTYYVYYRENDGEIFGYTTGSPPEGAEIPRFLAVDIEEPNSVTHKIDVVSCRYVPKSEEEISIALQPTAIEMACCVAGDLRASDQYVMLPDFPLSPEKKAEWIAYRQAIRDLSKPQNEDGRKLNPMEMVAEWPLRPDGIDPLAAIKARMEGAA